MNFNTILNFLEKLFFPYLRIQKKYVSKKIRLRVVFVSAIFSFLFLLVFFKSFYLSILPVSKKHKDTTQEFFDRKKIVDRNGEIIAININSYDLFVRPNLVQDKEKVATELTKIFPKIGYENIFNILTKDTKFSWIKRNITPKQLKKIYKMGEYGLDVIKRNKRVYPHKNLFSHILGYVNVDNKGIYGIENSYEYRILGNADKTLKLTLDKNIQYIVRDELQNAIKTYEGIGGVGIVMDITNGDILSLVSMPDFNPNASIKNDDSLFNKASYGLYELGSTFKVMNSALYFTNNEKNNFFDVFDTTKPIKLGGFVINDYHTVKYKQNVADIFVNSSNIGSALMALNVGAKKQKKFYKSLGLLDEIKFNINEKSKPIYPRNWNKSATITAAYGHGIAVTPLHLVKAVGGILNDGKMFEPNLIFGENKSYKRVVSKKVSDKVKILMRLNSMYGSGRSANVNGYYVGGKTGTSDKIKTDGTYSEEAVISSFVSAFPINNPKYAVYIMIDEPKANSATFGLRPTGGWVAAPAVGEIIKRMVSTHNIPKVTSKKELRKIELKGYKYRGHD